MVIEVRPPQRDEMADYYRALPGATGLPTWEPEDAAWHGGSAPWPPSPPPATPARLEEWADADQDDLSFHPVGAFVDGACVGASATISFVVTVPGSRTVRMAGVTGTGVLLTHRRRGALRAMMQAMLDAAFERGEPLAMLSASEGGIYGRFGFSPATFRTRWELPRHRAALLSGDPDPGSIHLVDAAGARAAWPALHQQVRRHRTGELTPPPGHWDALGDDSQGTEGPLRYLLHRDAGGEVDGLAHYRLPWSADSDGAGSLVVEALEATSPTAYRALWSVLLDVDLTKTVVAPGRPRTEPLRWLLADPRAMRVTRQTDNLWARVLDVGSLLPRRSYGGPGSLVLRVPEDPMCPRNTGSWRLDTNGTESECAATDDPPDLTVTVPALGSLFFGGVSAHELAWAGRITPHADGAVDLLARLFRTDSEPHSSFGF